jgi:uncharacterized membrane protein
MPPKAKREGSAARHLAVGVAVGLLVLIASLLAGGGWTVGMTGAWGAAALVTVASTWLRIGSLDAEETARHAKAEDYSRSMADVIVLGASVASLVSVGFALVQARHHGGTGKGLLIALAVAVVAVSWLAVHLVFTVRYGDLYYAEPDGGVDFNQTERPDYRDFVYFAITIGMTFQVSDTTVTSKTVRRQVTRHALLSYLFGAVIVALAINTVASLLQ